MNEIVTAKNGDLKTEKETDRFQPIEQVTYKHPTAPDTECGFTFIHSTYLRRIFYQAPGKGFRYLKPLRMCRLKALSEKEHMPLSPSYRTEA